MEQAARAATAAMSFMWGRVEQTDSRSQCHQVMRHRTASAQRADIEASSNGSDTDDDFSIDGHDRMEAYTQTMRRLAALALIPLWLLAQGIRDAKPKAPDHPLPTSVGD